MLNNSFIIKNIVFILNYISWKNVIRITKENIWFVSGLSERLKAFRFNKSTASRALILKVDPQRKLVIADGDEIEGVNVEELRDELPERQPRFVILAYRSKICDFNC